MFSTIITDLTTYQVCDKHNPECIEVGTSTTHGF